MSRLITISKQGLNANGTCNNLNRGLISINSSNIIKLIAALLIVTHHYSQYICANELAGYNNIIVNLFSSVIGYLSVASFFFLSGYGLTESENRRKSDSFWSFTKRRVVSVYMPFVIINILTIAIFQSIGFDKYTFVDALSYIFDIKVLDGVTWFVRVIMLFYIFFYISRKISTKYLRVLTIILFNVVYVLYCVFTDKFSTLYVMSVAFPFGVFASEYQNKIAALKFNWKNILAFVSVYTILPFIIYFLHKMGYMSLIYGISSIVICPFVIIFSKLIDSVFTMNTSKIAGLSYVIYLIHYKVFKAYLFENGQVNFIFYILLVVMLSIVIDVFISRVRNWLL